MGVVTALAEACAKHGVQQKTFIKVRPPAYDFPSPYSSVLSFDSPNMISFYPCEFTRDLLHRVCLTPSISPRRPLTTALCWYWPCAPVSAILNCLPRYVCMYVCVSIAPHMYIYMLASMHAIYMYIYGYASFCEPVEHKGEFKNGSSRI